MFFQNILGESDFEYIEALPLSDVYANPDQPRRTVNEEAVQDIVSSLNAPNGRIWMPIIVHAQGEDGRYKIIAGGRRFLASVIAKKETIPALVSHSEEIADGSKAAFTVAMLENVTRNDLSIFDEGAGYKHLKKEFNVSNKEIAETYGKSPSYISEAITVSETSGDPKLMFIAELYTTGETRDLSMLSKLVRLAHKNADVCKQLVSEALKNDSLTRKWVNSLTNVNLDQDLDEVLQNLNDRTEHEASNISNSTASQAKNENQTSGCSGTPEDDTTESSNVEDAEVHDDANSEGTTSEDDSAGLEEPKSYRVRPLNKAVVSVTYNNQVAELLLERVDEEEGFVWIKLDGVDSRVLVDDVSLLNIG
ncbi:ParB/RepB/Spo0J family partition protein [Vibrio ostreicida]|uniref:ParB/RepB/Spo0J family partition protein n=1 Tax=Vibrio ostreicida TaxID=526588 RepID=UPI003B5B3D4C